MAIKRPSSEINLFCLEKEKTAFLTDVKNAFFEWVVRGEFNATC